MPKGSEALLDFVHGFLAKKMESGRIDELPEAYIYGNYPEEPDPAA